MKADLRFDLISSKLKEAFSYCHSCLEEEEEENAP